MQAGNLDGTTNYEGGQKDLFEGLQLVDYDDLVDRNEKLHLLYADHRIVAYQNSTATGDSTVRCVAEVSAQPSMSQMSRAISGNPGNLQPDSAVGDASSDDTIDLIGRRMEAVATGSFSDSASGVGGAGSPGTDEVTIGGLPEPVAEFHPRDELFLNGHFTNWNQDDAGLHLDLVGQHVYGVTAD